MLGSYEGQRRATETEDWRVTTRTRPLQITTGAGEQAQAYGGRINQREHTLQCMRRGSSRRAGGSPLYEGHRSRETLLHPNPSYLLTFLWMRNATPHISEWNIYIDCATLVELPKCQIHDTRVTIYLRGRNNSDTRGASLSKNIWIIHCAIFVSFLSNRRKLSRQQLTQMFFRSPT